MTTWRNLDEELAAWQEAGRQPVLWWRDDDAARASDGLSLLLELRAASDLPLSLAVVPGLMEDSLEKALGDRQGLSLLQHGYRHENHATPGMKKIELGGTRSTEEILAALEAGKNIGEAVFGRGWLPVLVPPWNRIEDRIVPHLTALGFQGLSIHGRRRDAFMGLTVINSHLDILQWKPAAHFLGEAALLTQLTTALRTRRLEDTPGSEEPCGILTHHQAHDPESWRFLKSLFSHLKQHEVVSWKGAIPLFCETKRGDEP